MYKLNQTYQKPEEKQEQAVPLYALNMPVMDENGVVVRRFLPLLGIKTDNLEEKLEE
jgi:hypothetical protein